MKKEKIVRNAHTANTKYGMGDNYGSGIKQKVGRIREDQLGFGYVSNKKIAKPPKSIA